MEAFQQRVIDERIRLLEMLDKLTDFILSDIFFELPLDEQRRLNRQKLLMILYHDVLTERIENFQ